AARANFSGRPNGGFSAFAVEYLDLDPLQRKADGSELHIERLGREIREPRRRLGLAIHHEELYCGQLRTKALYEGPRHGAARLCQIAKRGQIEVMQVAAPEQQREGRRNAREARHTLVLHALKHEIRESEIVFDDECGAHRQVSVQYRVSVRKMER